MGAEGTNADALRFFYSGADSDKFCQDDPDACLGGSQSSFETRSIIWERENPLAGIRIRFVSGENGIGDGVLKATGASAITWTPPGGTAGTAVTIANGETLLVEGADTDKYVRIGRTSATDLTGEEVVHCLDQFNGAVGFDNVTSAEASAGDVEYRAIFLENVGSTTMDNVTVWLESAATLAIAKEAPNPAAGGPIQTIADEDTAPGGVAWVTGTSQGTGVVIGTLLAGRSYGLWIRRTIVGSAVASIKETNELHYSFDDSGATEHTGDLRGLYRIANDALSVYELYRGVDTEADLDGAPFETFASLPHTTAALAADHVYHFVLRLRNAFGLLVQNITETILTIDAGGDEVVTKPSNPEGVIVKQAADSKLNVTATYQPAEDGDNRADTWVIWKNDDDTDPDPDIDSPLDTVAMGDALGIEFLNFTTPAVLDASPCRVVVRTRRSSDSVDSSSVEVHSEIIDATGPVTPRWDTAFGSFAAQFTQPIVPGIGDKYYVDEDLNIFLQPDGAGVSFYADTVLIWRSFIGATIGTGTIYIPNAWDLINQEISGAGGSDPIEVANWNGLKRLYIVVNGIRRCFIDVAALEIRADTFNLPGIPTNSDADVAVWPRFDSTLFQQWGCADATWFTYLEISDSGEFIPIADINQALTQGEIEAL